MLDPRLALHRLRHQARHGDELADQPRLGVRVDHAAGSRQRHRQRGQHAELAGEGFGRGDADLRPGEGGRDDMAFARDGRGRDIDDAEHMLALRLGIAQRGQRVRRLARLRHDDGQPALFHRRLAVAELARHIDLNRHARDPLEPVFRGEARDKRRAAGDDGDARHALKRERQIKRQRDAARRHIEIMGERAPGDLRLLMDFLRHEMAEIALVDEQR